MIVVAVGIVMLVCAAVLAVALFRRRSDRWAAPGVYRPV